MKPIAMTLLATASEPSPLDARAHAIKNCASVILGLASTIERHVDRLLPRKFRSLQVRSQPKSVVLRMKSRRKPLRVNSRGKKNTKCSQSKDSIAN